MIARPRRIGAARAIAGHASCCVGGQRTSSLSVSSRHAIDRRGNCQRDAARSALEVHMGIFDKMFGKGAAEAEEQKDAQQRFSELKQKYQTVLNAADAQHIQFQNLHVKDNKLFIRAKAPSEQAKNALWDQIKLVNPKADDITADISVNPQAPAQTSPAATTGAQTYTVKSGDTLSKISKQYYGDAHEYMRIFYANREQLNDPNKIRVGQQLTIPPDNA
jgi:nucleoid-associated protein YgaU